MDLTNIAPGRRTELISQGRRFGSELVLAQARKTLAALQTHGSKLVDFGFGSADTTELAAAYEELVTSGGVREGRRTTKKQNSLGYHRAFRDALDIRLRARAVLTSGRRALARTEGADVEQAIRLIDSVLARGSVAPQDAGPLANQLDELRLALGDATIAPIVASRGGPSAVTELAEHATLVRAADKAIAGPRGTPEHTERLDLVDGVVLELVRSAREAAEVASKALGEPALVTVFSLSELYPATPATNTNKPSGPGVTPPRNDPPHGGTPTPTPPASSC
ncbi:hypothetical protein [Chondromyces crocatus]|uniref:Uncharacterized protein n=1 Tax=Chondromyces crocatus TaxID=52 RepID=A0A0K1EEM5_CHOCO|nr:hypothetical protein [Chondromyces crocatus]AKT39321.1 uncharacterized protein CMC5_034680 [Chondromyces crocatus]